MRHKYCIPPPVVREDGQADGEVSLPNVDMVGLTESLLEYY